MTLLRSSKLRPPVLCLVGSMIFQGCGSLTLPSLTFNSGNTRAASEVAPIHQPIAITARFSITSIVGLPPDSIPALRRSINTAAVSAQLALMAEHDESVDVTLHGYFSIERRNARSDISYIWDALDSQGNRVSRSSGTLPAKAAGTNSSLHLSEVDLSEIAQRAVSAVLSRPQQSPSNTAGLPSADMTRGAGASQATRPNR